MDFSKVFLFLLLYTPTILREIRVYIAVPTHVNLLASRYCYHNMSENGLRWTRGKVLRHTCLYVDTRVSPRAYFRGYFRGYKTTRP